MKERDLHSVLSSFQKPVLEDICYLLGSETSFRLKKRDLVSSLSDYLRSKPRRWLDCLMERDLLLLKTLVGGGPEKVQYMEIGHYHSLLEISGLIDVQDDGGRYQQVTLSREVYDIVVPHLDEAIAKGNKSGRFEFERAALGFLNIYGMVPVSQFLDFVQDWCDAGYGPGIKRLLVLVQDSPLIKMCRFTDDEYGDYLITPCVDNLPKMMEERARYGFKEGEFKPLDAVEEAMLAGNGAPFFTVGMESAEGLELVRMLRQIGFEEDDMRRIVHEIWLDAQSEDVGDMIYNAVYAKDEFIRSDSEFKRCLQVVADFANSIPLWRLCGFSAREQGLEIFYIPDDYLAAPEASEEEDDSGHPHWTMPAPSVSKGYETSAEDLPSELKKLLPGGFPFGMAVPHVAPDDACPCGSGLRYKNCHGKIMN